MNRRRKKTHRTDFISSTSASTAQLTACSTIIVRTLLAAQRLTVPSASVGALLKSSTSDFVNLGLLSYYRSVAVGL
jgi:hypothetical protein